MTLKLAVLVSGKGGNLTAIARAIDSGHCDARIEAVISDRASAAALAFARDRGIATAVVSPREHATRDEWDAALTARIAQSEPDLVVLAGFMRLVGSAFLARFERRVINVHPALLPLFPGTTGPEQAIAAGVRISGCTVHLVDSGVDTGPIIAQAAVRVLAQDTPQTLHERIARAEHMLFPRVIDAIAKRRITLDPAPRIAPSALSVAPSDAMNDTAVFFSPDEQDGTP